MTPAESLSLAARIRLEVERLGQQGVRASATFGQASSVQDTERALELAAYEMATYYSGLDGPGLLHREIVAPSRNRDESESFLCSSGARQAALRDSAASAFAAG